MLKKIRPLLLSLKKHAPLIIICAVVVITCRQVLFAHYENIARGKKSDLIYALESSLLDLKFKLRGKKKPTKKIGILAIDEKTIQEFKRWPFSRKYYGKALENLKNAGVEWVGFDVIFSEPETASIADASAYLDLIKNSPPGMIKNNVNTALNGIDRMRDVAPGDLEFAQAIANFERVVLGFFYYRDDDELKLAGKENDPFQYLDPMESSMIEMIISSDENFELSQFPQLKKSGVVANIPQLGGSTNHFAFFSNEADEDAIVRSASMVAVINDGLYPSMSLKVAAEAMNRDIVVFFNEIGVESIALVNREDDADSIDLPVDFYGRGRVLINHLGPGYQTFPHISLADAYTGNFSDKAKEFLPGSVLLVGATATGTNDQRPNPFDPQLDGVENHAAIADNIMSQDFLKRLPEMQRTEMNLVLGIGLIFSPILIFSSAISAGFVSILFCIGYYWYDKIQWFDQGVWAYMAMPYIEIFSLFIFITLYKYATEEREKRKVKGAFSHYLSQDVMEQVLEDPDTLALGGERKELTVFFSDVRGFTTISESLTPENLCQLMNEYFTPMTDIILKNKGVLDKYIGDAIMAFWGAPIEIEDHADVTAEASIEMLQALDKIQSDFEAKNYPWVDIGIGVNSGPMSVGNMGSDERFQYTVMGDSVNLGARLEGMTKNYGVRCMISEYTVKQFKRPKNHIIRDLDDIQVKGKTEPVKVFELLRPDYLKYSEQLSELVGLFEEGRKKYREQELEQASNLFKQCLLIHPDDGPASIYLKRIAEMQQHPKIENWDGVTRYKTK